MKCFVYLLSLVSCVSLWPCIKSELNSETLRPRCMWLPWKWEHSKGCRDAFVLLNGFKEWQNAWASGMKDVRSGFDLFRKLPAEAIKRTKKETNCSQQGCSFPKQVCTFHGHAWGFLYLWMLLHSVNAGKKQMAARVFLRAACTQPLCLIETLQPWFTAEAQTKPVNNSFVFLW